MATETVRIEGLRELDAALGELPKATAKNVLKRVLLKRAQPMAAAMKAMAPDDPETHGKDLRESIGASTTLSRHEKTAHRAMFRDDKASVEVFVGAGPLRYARIQEFYGGGHGVPGTPHPYVRPAWDSGKAALLDGIKEDLWAEISKSAARLAKKTAKFK